MILYISLRTTVIFYQYLTSITIEYIFTNITNVFNYLGQQYEVVNFWKIKLNLIYLTIMTVSFIDNLCWCFSRIVSYFRMTSFHYFRQQCELYQQFSESTLGGMHVDAASASAYGWFSSVTEQVDFSSRIAQQVAYSPATSCGSRT